MPVYVICRCGRRFVADSKYAGRSTKCPACGEQLKIPDQFVAADVPIHMEDKKPEIGSTNVSKDQDSIFVGSEELPSPRNEKCVSSGKSTSAPIGNEAKKKCPFCSEQILATAIKCRYCGSMLRPCDGIPGETRSGSFSIMRVFGMIGLLAGVLVVCGGGNFGAGIVVAIVGCALLIAGEIANR